MPFSAISQSAPNTCSHRLFPMCQPLFAAGTGSLSPRPVLHGLLLLAHRFLSPLGFAQIRRL
jgi:hypothetical protein